VTLLAELNPAGALAGISATVSDVELRLGSSIGAAELRLSRESAHTLRVRLSDEEGTFISRLPADPDFDLLDLPLRRVRISKKEKAVALTFEDRRVSWMRGYDDPRMEYGTRTTREGFIYHLIREVKEGELSLFAPLSASRGSVSQRYPFSRGQGRLRENTWSCAGRLAAESSRRRFMVGDAMAFVSDAELLKRNPEREIIPRDTERFDFDLDSEIEDRAYLTIPSTGWSSPLGSTIRIVESGPADGVWIVHELRRNLRENNLFVTLVR